MFKSGFVAIIGRPNVGKSTFLNKVLGQKVSIISPKPQTTRNQIRGIYTTSEMQCIFIDTPGIHKPHNELGSIMNTYSNATFNDVDLILWLIDSTEKFGGGDSYIIQLLKNCKTPVILVANKIDLIKNKNDYLLNINDFKNNHTYKEVWPISALNGDNIDKLLLAIKDSFEEGPMYYPEDQISDNPQPFIIAELIREKILLLTKEEVPHSIAVVVDEIKDEDNLTNVRATIYCERSSQKKIIIGSGGKMIKEIGSQARKDIVMLLGNKIFLDLWVKVEDKWRDKKNILKRLGYYENN